MPYIIYCALLVHPLSFERQEQQFNKLVTEVHQLLIIGQATRNGN